jgi:superfamily II DNA/RNA helicase
LPDTDTPRARPRRRTATPAEPVAIEVGDADAPSELEAAVLAAAAGYRFGDIEVPATIARALERMRFVTPTEVQARAIPPLRRGEDLIGQAQTGTGKTAAFGIPIVEKTDPSGAYVQALILTPTRELCVQVDEEVGRIG